jgi:putative Holliday junction resolvase
MRCLGIDYGEKRIGLAYGDELGVATPLPAAVAPAFADRMRQIADLVKVRGITDLVVGYPYNMDGSVGFKAQEVDDFIRQLEAVFRLPVHRVDERLTSHSIEQELKLSGRRERALRKSGVVDSGAATLILQDWLAQHAPLPDMVDPEYGED